MRESGLFDYIVVNEDVDTAIQHLKGISQRALAGEVSALLNQHRPILCNLSKIPCTGSSTLYVSFC